MFSYPSTFEHRVFILVTLMINTLFLSSIWLQCLAKSASLLSLLGFSLRHTLDRDWKAVLSQSSIAPNCQHVNVAKPRS
jgi:hypothetical protein